AGEAVRVRNPEAVRPWQHVLNPLSGYLNLTQALWRTPEAASAWNFGPAPEDARTVGWIVRSLSEHWGGALRWEAAEGPAGGPDSPSAAGGLTGAPDPPEAGRGPTGEPDPPEAGHLALDSTRAERGLGWRPPWGLEEALENVVEWHEAHRRGEDTRQTTVSQIERFDKLAT
ncbi:MAG: hypothetical protein ACHQE6_11785, partial [Solirubrobacterales bacterium]